MRADILMLQAEIDSARVQTEILQNKRQPQQTMISSYLGRKGVAAITTEKEIFSNENMDRDEFLKAIEQHPEIRRIQRTIEMNRAEIDASERMKIPDLMLGAMLMRMPNGMVQTMSSRASVQSETGGMPKTDYMYSLMA